MPNDLLVAWFNALEESLVKEAEIAGLFRHRGTMGTAREFVVNRCLRSFLPLSAEIGTGEVVDCEGNRSKQIDVVVYDPRFPALRTGAGSLFLVEGVIAAIEVKSTLTKERLEDALSNCASVSNLSPRLRRPAEKDEFVRHTVKTQSVSVEEAEYQFDSATKPATYVYAFNSEMALETTVKTVTEWALRNGSNLRFGLPKVITSGNDILHSGHGPYAFKTAAGAIPPVWGYRSDHRFRYFAVHLFTRIGERIGLREGITHSDYEIRSHIPIALMKPDTDVYCVENF